MNEDKKDINKESENINKYDFKEDVKSDKGFLKPLKKVLKKRKNKKH